jgi:class 3 adenylate cyclase/DNA-binding winged helix-turn-helix (wHTH) protein/tetratricopeptide (TPR) repeat protein
MRYVFGDYTLDTQRYELHCARARVHLRPKVFQVLAYLLAHRDRVVPKAELLEHVWPGQFIGDATLNSCIMAVRKALRDGGRTPYFLHTVYGQGYRFVAPVEERAHLAADATPLVALPIAGALHPLAPHGDEGWDEGGTPTIRPTLHPPLPPLPAGAGALHETQPPLANTPGGEHKQVTVLCGALAEAPALAGRLGPEAMHHLMHTVLALAQEVLQRYEGMLTHVSGEGFLALFGAPLAQEDHARRAVLAACELRQRLRTLEMGPGQPPGVAVCLGLHTGPVVVGPLAHDPQRPYTAVGDTLLRATQLQSLARPDILLVSAATYALVQDEVQGEACDTLALDGPSPPVPVYAMHGLRRRRAGVPRRGARPLSHFVGRTQELALLHKRLAQARDGQGQVIGIAGEPGMGKSRLLAEFAHSLDGQLVTYCEGHCLAYGQATPYLPVRDLLRQLWGLPDAPATAITATVQQRLHEAGVASEAEALLLLQFLDVPVDLAPVAALSPEVRKARTFALLRHLVWHASQQQCLLLAVENLHWSDPTSEEWLASLVERLGDTPVVLLATYRPGYQPSWLGHAVATQMALPRLSPCESLVVLQSVPQAAQLPVALQQTIVAKAAGNPFFVEELTWAAVANGDPAATLPLPDTIEAVLAAPLDRLSPEAKRLVQLAAVIGPQVPVPLLQAIADLPEATLHRGLAHLQAAVFLYETRLFPAPEYTFKHTLTHEVAYGSLLLERRRILHTRLVEALETLAPDRGAEQVERLAHHALRGEVWDKAVAYCQQAGARAYGRAAFREAVAAFEQALQALAHLPEDDARGLALDLRLALGVALSALGEYGRRRTLLGEAEALARELADRARLGRVLAETVQVLSLMGDLDGAMAAGQQARELAVELGDSALQAQASHRLGQIYWSIGDFGRAAELLRHNVEAVDGKSVLMPGFHGSQGLRRHVGAADGGSDTPSTGLRLQSRAWLARPLSELGAFSEGRRHGEEALRLATMEGRGNTPILAHNFLGNLYLAQGDLEPAIRVLEQGLALCRASGERTNLRPIAAGLGYAYALQGRLAEGWVLLEEASSEDIRTGGLGGHTGRLTWLSEVCRLAGRGEEAGQHARQTLDLARQQKQRGNEAHALHQLGVVQAHADPPDTEQAETHYQQALALAEELGMRPLQAHCHLGLGTLYARIGRREQARTALATAIALYRAMDMTFWLPQAEAALAQIG